MKVEKCYLEEMGYDQFENFISIVAGKWKLRIIYVIAAYHVLRYSEIKRLLEPITHKTLTNQLKELEKDDLIHREVYQQMPPKVEYSLTEKGKDLNPLGLEAKKFIDKYYSKK